MLFKHFNKQLSGINFYSKFLITFATLTLYMLNSDFSLLNINNLIIELLNFRITGSKKILFARLLKFSSATRLFFSKKFFERIIFHP